MKFCGSDEPWSLSHTKINIALKDLLAKIREPMNLIKPQNGKLDQIKTCLIASILLIATINLSYLNHTEFLRNSSPLYNAAQILWYSPLVCLVALIGT